MSAMAMTLAEVALFVENYIHGLTEQQGREKPVMAWVVEALGRAVRADLDVTVDPFRRKVHLICGGSEFAVFRYYYPGEPRVTKH
jgi:hypothetical protein